MDFSQLLMYVPGVIIFLVGSGQVRQYLRTHRTGVCADASVLSCDHVVKKDKKDRDIYNYYNVFVEYKNPLTNHTERRAVKSPTELAVAQQVRLYGLGSGGTIVLSEESDEGIFNPWMMMIGGALLIVLALEQNRGNEVQAMICLSAILIGAGIALIVNYISLKRRTLQPIDAEITGIYTRQISKETKLLISSKYTYYPIVRYEIDGRENIRRCNINSSGKDTFKVGEHMTLYLDPKSNAVTERHAQLGAAIAGGVLLCSGIAAALSILSVVL